MATSADERLAVERDLAAMRTALQDDARLKALGLPLNAEMQEGEPLTAEEQAYVSDEIAPRLKDASATFAALDETSRIRIYRGMITNNKGTPEERLAEAARHARASRPIPNESSGSSPECRESGTIASPPDARIEETGRGV